MICLVVASMLAAVPAPSSGQAQAPSPPAPGARAAEDEKKLEEEIAKELGASPSQGSSTPAAAPAAGSPAPPSGAGGSGSGQTGGNPWARLLLMPDISAIGSAALAWNKLDVAALSPRSDPFAPANTVQPVFQELELGVQAVIDPYARADIFLSFTPEGAEVEEAYATFLRLPYGLQARAGEMFAPFGRLNQQHPHVWDFVDRPLALARLVGTDNLAGPGVDVAWLAPLPWFAELHLAYQALTPGEDLGLPEASANSGTLRLGQFFDLSDAATLGVGLSAVRMDEPEGGRDLYGADAYLKIRPPNARSYLALQGELVARRLFGIGVAPGDPDLNGTRWGGYAQAVWRDGPFWAYGVRYERAPAQGGGTEQRATALADWLLTEFQRIRFELGYDRLPGGADGLEALLQLEFAIGVHGAHPF
jgi:hypothetical protein